MCIVTPIPMSVSNLTLMLSIVIIARDVRRQQFLDSLCCLMSQLITASDFESRYSNITLKLCNRIRSTCLTSHGGLICPKITLLGKQAILDQNNTTDCLNPTGLGDKADFLCEYSDSPKIYLISETQ